MLHVVGTASATASRSVLDRLLLLPVPSLCLSAVNQLVLRLGHGPTAVLGRRPHAFLVMGVVLLGKQNNLTITGDLYPFEGRRLAQLRSFLQKAGAIVERSC